MNTEQTLRLCLEYAKLGQLPKASSTSDYISAIVLVRKNNGVDYYCIEDTSKNGMLSIKCDYEGFHRIIEVRERYVYHRFDKRFIPKFKSEEEKIKFLNKTDTRLRIKFNGIDSRNLTESERDEMIMRYARLSQLEAENKGNSLFEIDK